MKTAVDEDQVAYLYEHQSEFPGVQIQQTYLRHYPYQSLAAQVLGYVGEVSQSDLDTKPKVYKPGDKVGKAGVEAKLDEWLRGEAGQAQIRVDSMGRPQGPLEPRREARAGNAVRLTIDIGLQRAAERALRFGIQTAHANESYYANGGALVALDPRDGAVLAMASTPTFKPSVYVGRVDPKKIQPLLNDEAAKKANYPGINRVTSGEYPPGSTWKPVTALAAMQEHLLEPYQSLQCTPTATYGLDQQVFRNWDPYVNHAMTLPEALARSCDTYFYQLGYRFYLEGDKGRTRMQQWARKFGFGSPAGIDVGTEESRAHPDSRLAQADLLERLGPRLEPGGLDPARDRPEGRVRDAAADGAVLRDARERRQARDPVRRLPGGDRGPQRAVSPSSSSGTRPTHRSPSGSTPPRCR